MCSSDLRFSEAFLVLRAAEAGLSAAYLPLVLVVMSIVYSLASYPAGALSDRVGRGGLLAAGLAALLGADIVLAWGQSLAAVIAGVALWGLHMGLSQGLLAALVADATPTSLRATGFGAFNTLCVPAASAASKPQANTSMTSTRLTRLARGSSSWSSKRASSRE